MGLGERSLEAKRRHGAAPDRGWLPAPAPVPSVPPALRGPGAPRPAPPGGPPRPLQPGPFLSAGGVQDSGLVARSSP